MKNFKRLAVGVDTAPLLGRIDERPHLWGSGRERQQYPGSAHAQAEAIVLRWATDRSLAGAFRCLEAEDLPAAHELMPHVASLTNQIVDRVGLSRYTGRAMITRLAPGGRIAPHVDEGLYADVYDRFHLCLDAEAGSLFRCGGEAVHMAPGEIWWFNHKREHEVVNEGARPRLHLILDLDTVAYKSLRGLCFQAELLADLQGLPELEELFAAHWREVARYQDVPLEIDWPFYLAAEARGETRMITAREGGELVGYALFLLPRHPHYTGLRQARQDILYLAPEHRRGRAGLTLIRVAETRLRAEGVQLVYHHAKPASQMGELLRRLGYELFEEIYARRLDEEKRR